MRRPDNVLQISGDGVQATAGAASDVTAVPTMASGVKARRVVIAVVTASEVAMVKLVPSSGGTVTTATGLPVSRDMGPVILSIGGTSHIAHIRAGAVDCVFNIVPLAD